jgi:hypothetical protein
MDEYFQGKGVMDYFDQFVGELHVKRNMGCRYIENAGGFGGLFRLYPLGTSPDRLVLNAEVKEQGINQGP